jgi:hypothetical protein
VRSSSAATSSGLTEQRRGPKPTPFQEHETSK